MKRAMLKIENVWYKAGGKNILKGCTLSVGKGQICSVIGVNGTGKTTLAAILLGLNGYKPVKGRILFIGKDITRLPTNERARMGLTLAWQIPANFEGITVRDYLSIAHKGIAPEECLKAVGLKPDSYMDRFLDESLSGGERKRIEIASVLSLNPKLVILDEPDSGIDMASISAIKKVIRSFKERGTSVILITHSEVMARIGDKAALLCDGRIEKEGTVEMVTNFFKTHCKECGYKEMQRQ